MSALRERLGRLDRTRVDALFTVLMIVELELELWLLPEPAFMLGHRPLQAVAAVFYAAPIAVRRRWPAGALVCFGVAALAQAIAGGYLVDALVGTTVPPAVLGYAAGAWLDLRRGLIGLLLGVGLFAGSTLVSDVIAAPAQHAAFATDLVVDSLLIAGPWLVGRLARERNRRAAAFRELAAQAVAERDERARSAIALERIRIGRELQDIIAHSVSAMVIQAGGARRLLRTEPERARDSILSVEQTGREALADLRQLLGMLRKDDDPRALAPQPGLDQLAVLLTRVRDQGVECELSTEGERFDLTPGIDLVSYRVIETALQLLARHRSRLVTVTVRYEQDGLELEISGETSIPDPDHELRGIAERVALYDGNLGTLPARDGGFKLRARFPLGGAVAA